LKYLNVKRLKRTSTKEVRSLLEDTIGMTFSGSSDIKDTILGVVFLTGYITAADLSYYLGMPENSFKSLHRQLDDLVKGKYLAQIGLDGKDGMSKVLYYTTELGFMAAASFMSKPFYFSYKRRGKAATTIHDYSNGLNALQLLLYGTPFCWSREVTYSSSGNGKKHLGTLCIDGIVDFYESGKRIFFEEDLGNETIATLLGKLSKYKAYGLLDEPAKTSLIYSMRKPYITADSPSFLAFSPQNIDSLIKYMSCGKKTLNEAILSLKEEKSPLYDVAKSLSDIYSSLGIESKATVYTLESYKTDLEELKLDERVCVINKVQDTFCKSRMRSLAGLLYKKYRSDFSIDADYIRNLLQGYSAYFIPTPLIASYLPFIELKESGLAYSIYELLKAEYKGLSPFNGSPLFLDDKKDLVLKNMATFDSGRVAVEYAGRDVGAIIRLIRFMETDYKDVQMICLVDDSSDVFFIKNVLMEGHGRYDNIRFLLIEPLKLGTLKWI
jgi:hypothetical protein